MAQRKKFSSSDTQQTRTTLFSSSGTHKARTYYLFNKENKVVPASEEELNAWLKEFEMEIPFEGNSYNNWSRVPNNTPSSPSQRFSLAVEPFTLEYAHNKAGNLKLVISNPNTKSANVKIQFISKQLGEGSQIKSYSDYLDINVAYSGNWVDQQGVLKLSADFKNKKSLENLSDFINLFLEKNSLTDTPIAKELLARCFLKKPNERLTEELPNSPTVDA